MSDNLPAIPDDLKDLPAPLAQEFAAGTPMQRLFGTVLNELGGVSFLAEWAEEYPTQFVQIMVAQFPGVAAAAPTGGTGTNIHIHPSLSPSPLDAGKGPGVTIDAED